MLSSKTYYEFLIYPMHVTCPSHLILLDLITQVILCKEYLEPLQGRDHLEYVSLDRGIILKLVVWR
jgi:hypothetical protein